MRCPLHLINLKRIISDKNYKKRQSDLDQYTSMIYQTKDGKEFCSSFWRVVDSIFLSFLTNPTNNSIKSEFEKYWKINVSSRSTSPSSLFLSIKNSPMISGFFKIAISVFDWNQTPLLCSLSHDGSSGYYSL